MMTHVTDAVLHIVNWIYPDGLIYIAALSLLVFVHEFGHFWVARRCGVRVEMFSIGFGGELFGWTDRLGTRWRVGWLPIGGFVKMFGDADAASRPDFSAATAMTPLERRVSFIYKALWQKALIISAGPGANFLFAIVVMATLFATYGQPFTPPVVGKVQAGSAAEEAGLQPGDVVQTIDGAGIDRFEDLRQIVLLHPGETLLIALLRDGQTLSVAATPRMVEEKDIVGNTERIGLLGVSPSSDVVLRHENIPTALWQATREVWSIASNSLEAIGQMITGRRSADDLHGPIGIGRIVGEVSHQGFLPFIQLVAFISVSLGLVNLFPIPVLDGGHLLFYAIEAVRRRPISERTLAVGFRLGLALIVSFFVFVTWNDITKH
jgi:regulator of sigma E protease